MTATNKKDGRLPRIRLRFAINSLIDDRGITSPAAIAEAVGLPVAEATSLLSRTRVREGDLEALRQVAARLGLVENPVSGHWQLANPEAA